MPTIPKNSLRSSSAVLALACLASACSTVDLGYRYDPPPVRMPPPPATAPVAPPPVVQSSPVAPSQPVPQPLPPYGSDPASAPRPPSLPALAPADPRANLVTLSTRLDGASALPPTRTSGVGQLDAIYDSNTRLFRWKASWSGLSGTITGVQFHGPADYGQNGPATLVWPGPFGPTYEGRATLTPEQAVDLLDGRWYLNVRTSAYPAGELRGQLRVVH